MEKIISYHMTIWACDKHIQPHKFVACSPANPELFAKNLMCPKCKKFGLRCVKQNPVVRYKTTFIY